MINRERVIKVIENCVFNKHDCFICEYDGCVLKHGDCRGDLLADAYVLLKKQEWNVLTEDADGVIHGLPGDDGTYLMTDGEDIWVDDYVDGVDDGVWLNSGRDIREIKAWMYMPELPKKERQ